MTPYETSVMRALRDMARSHVKVPMWLPGMLARLPARISAMHPVEVVCLRRLVVDNDQRSFASMLNIQLLLQRGWSRELSFAAYKNFRFVYPVVRFPIEAHRVMPRGALVDEYGGMYGNLLADLCVDPDCQPYLHALLTGDLDRCRWRPMLDALLRYDMDLLTATVQPDLTLPGGAIDATPLYRSGPGSTYDTTTAPQTLPHTEATEIYREATGMMPDFVFTISPLDLDYEALAAAGQPVWKINPG